MNKRSKGQNPFDKKIKKEKNPHQYIVFKLTKFESYEEYFGVDSNNF